LLRKYLMAAIPALSLIALGLPVAASASTGSADPDYKAACSEHEKGYADCLVLVRTKSGVSPLQPPPGAYGPADLQNAYDLPSATAGSGQTVAIVDAYGDPNAQADLNAYRTQYGLPACGTGCFTQYNQTGGTTPPAADPTGDWEIEESLDVDMVSAICPLCKIDLVAADSNSYSDLGTAVDEAVALGADYVSNSYGGSEGGGSDTPYNHPGVVITASAGDSGYGVSFPAASPYVVSVGGTTLNHTGGGGRGWSETVWGSSSGGEGTGSGCSAVESKPTWQTDPGCANRTDNDVAAVADPNTGVAIYDSYPNTVGSCGTGWCTVGGTSASSPIIASVYALAGTPTPGSYPASYLYANPESDLYDVTSGADGSCTPAYLCTGEVGYDGPTGLGTPDGTAAFKPPGTDVVTVTNPGPQTSTAGTAITPLQIAATSSKGLPLTFSATGLPAGLSISGSGKITGTPSAAGTNSVTVKATDGTASGSVTFNWVVTAPPDNVTVANPGPQTGTVGTAVSLPINATSSAGKTLTYSATGLPAGLTIDSSTGVISGTPTAAGTSSVTVTAADSTPASGSATFAWTVTAAPDKVTVTNPGHQTNTKGTPVTLAIKASSSAGKTLTYSASGLPAGLTINPGTGVVSGTPTTAGTSSVTVTAKDSTPASGAASFTWTITAGTVTGAIRNARYPRCLDDLFSSTRNGNPIDTWLCNGTAAQRWTAATSGVTTLKVLGKCLDHTGGDAVRLWSCNGSPAQMWRHVAGGAYVNPATGRCLTATSRSPGARVVLRTCNGSKAETWAGP
jgi:hypothetical protein